MGPEGTQVDPTQATPIGRIPTEDSPAPVLPTLNPADSPYTPLSLPTVEPKQLPVPEQAPVENLGATSRGGAIAYIANQILTGAMKGYDFKQQRTADQFNKKLAAQQEVYNDQVKQFRALSEAGYGPVLSDPSKLDPSSPEFQAASPEWKAAFNRVFATHQAILQTIGERIPQPKQSKKSKQGQASGQDQSNLLQRVLNHQNDPEDALQAWYQAASTLGPSVFHDMAPYFTKQYQQQQRQKAQTAATGAQAAQDTEAVKARLAALIAKPNQTPEDVAEINRLKEQMAPVPKTPVELVRTGQDKDGKWFRWKVDQEGNEIADTRQPLSTAGLNRAPKMGWTKVDGKWGSQLYDPETNQPIEGTFDASKVPPSSILSMYPTEHTLKGKFVDDHGVLQTYSTTSTSSRDLPLGIGEGTPAPSKPRTMVVPNPKGLVEPGNIPIDNRPVVRNADGTHSTEYSVSFEQDGKEILVPTVVNGKFLTPDGKKPKEGSPEEQKMFKAAWQHYLDTGEHLGKFDNADDADAYANQLHNRGSAISHEGKSPSAPSGKTPPTSEGPKTTPIGYVGSPAYKQLTKQATDAQKEFNSASTNLSTMLKTAAEAKRGNGAAQVGIISAYLKSVVGGQGTGVRITKPEWEAVTKTRPFLQGIQATFSPDGVMTGAAISPQQVDQMVQEVHAKTKSLFDTVQSAKQRAADQRKADMEAGGLGAKPAPKTGFDWNAHPKAE